MTTYTCDPVTVEAMQWDGASKTVVDVHDEMHDAETIVEWVTREGGEAKYEPAPTTRLGDRRGGVQALKQRPQIKVRSIDGWKTARQGHFIVMMRWFAGGYFDGRVPQRPGLVRGFEVVHSMAELRPPLNWRTQP